MKETVLQQINILNTTNAVSKSLLEELTRKAGALEQEHTSSTIGIDDSSVENLQAEM